METIFLSENEKRFHQVYTQSQMERICRKSDGILHRICKQDILLNPQQFVNTRYIFSTWGMPAFTEEEIKSLFPNLEAVFYAAGSVQGFAKPFLNCGIKVYSAWMANAIPVAEYTVAQIILANKGYFRAAHQMSSGDYSAARTVRDVYPGNYNAKIGIIGLGAIGDLVCQMLKTYHLDVVAYSRSLTEDRAKSMGVEKSTVEEIFKTCDVVSNHIADNPHTKGIFKREHFASMKPNAVFLNTGRGAQVVEEDLATVLAQRPDLTAVLDVTDPEPPVQGSPFYRLPNCILTPHIAGSNGMEVRRMAQWMEEEFDLYRQGKACRYEVTAQMLERMA